MIDGGMVSMIAYNNIKMLQNQISSITKKMTVENVKSICGNQFYKKTYKDAFYV